MTQAAELEETVDGEVTGPELGSPEWVDNATDRELLEYLATNLFFISKMMVELKDMAGPTIEKIAGAMKLMGIG